MKTLRLLLAIATVATCSLRAQEPDTPAPFPAVVLTAGQLEQLLAPIALYPDALIALILPASTVPADIVLAARYLKENPGDFSQVEHRAWDDSVKSLTHYPDVVQWLDENLNWTKQVGEAFATQPADVMNAIQRLRARAQASGALTTTPQQQVLAEPDVIRIVPADPEIIYVPRYDPAVVFVDRPYYGYSAPLLTFGFGWRVGSWLAYDFDWRRCTLWVGDRHRHWTGRHDWRRPVVPIGPPPRSHVGFSPPARMWRPPPRTFRPLPLGTTADARPHVHVPGAAATLARTYDRTSVPPAPRPPPSVTPSPSPMDMNGTDRVYRPQTYSHSHNRSRTVSTPPAAITSDGPERAARETVRPGGRGWPSAAPATPGLSVVGRVSTPPATVGPPPSRAVSSHLGHGPATGRLAPPPPPASVSAPAYAPIQRSPAPPPSVQPAPRAVTPTPPAATPPAAGRPTHNDTRGHSRPRDLP